MPRLPSWSSIFNGYTGIFRDSVIIGPDFIIRDGVAITDATQRSKMDSSIRGYKKLFKEDEDLAKQKADAIIKNTYRTLMSRSMKGCYLYCTDEETNAWFKQLMGRGVHEYEEVIALQGEEIESTTTDKYPGLTLRLLEPNKVKPYENSVPVYGLDAAAGSFSETQTVNEAPQAGDIASLEEYDWVELPDSFRTKPGLFVARVVGESMNKRIPNGSWCLFNLNPGGTRQGKVVLVQHRNIEDPDTGGQYTVKLYESEKIIGEEGGWQHSRITLKPDSTESIYQPMVFDWESAEELVVIAELVAVIG